MRCKPCREMRVSLIPPVALPSISQTNEGRTSLQLVIQCCVAARCFHDSTAVSVPSPKGGRELFPASARGAVFCSAASGGGPGGNHPCHHSRPVRDHGR